MLGYADLVFMSSEARLRCPFTSLGVAPEAGSSFLFPRMMGRQEASWLLLSSEWIDAERCCEVGLAWKVCEPGELLDVALDHAGHLAGFALESLVEGKRLIVEPLLAGLADARAREGAAFGRLLGSPASSGALEDFAGGCPPGCQSAGPWSTECRRRMALIMNSRPVSHSLVRLRPARIRTWVMRRWTASNSDCGRSTNPRSARGVVAAFVGMWFSASVGCCLGRDGVQGTCPCRVAAFTGAPCHRGSAAAAAPT